MVRRLFGFSLIFLLGVGAGWTILHAQSVRPVSATEAQRRALRMLEQNPPSAGIGDNRIVAAVQKIAPAVVNIDTVGKARSEGETGGTFGAKEVRGKGSGVILTSDGYIVTNNHVIDGANRVRVTLSDNRWYYARLIGRDPQTDLAVVRVEASGLPTAELGDSDRLQVGEWSIAVGNPLGLGSTITVGVISALNRHNLQIEEGRTLDGAIQTDAAINRGNSGGALANINGQLVGINTAILSSTPNGGNIGLGFSIPSNTVRRVAHEIIATGAAMAPRRKTVWLGIQYAQIAPDAETSTPDNSSGGAVGQGVLVDRVMPQSPAYQAGIEEGDILLTIDGKVIGDPRDVKEAVAVHRAGERVVVHFLRPALHRERDVTVILQDAPASLSFRP